MAVSPASAATGARRGLASRWRACAATCHARGVIALHALVALVLAAPPGAVPPASICPPGVHDTHRPAAACVDPVADRVWLPRIDWPTHKERLPPPAVDAAAQALAALLIAVPSIAQVRIEGHLETNHAFRWYGRKVCQNRAEALAERVIRAGVARERVVAVGYGDDRPIHDPRTAEGRLLNRRFELHVTRWRAAQPEAPITTPPPPAPTPAPAR